MSWSLPTLEDEDGTSFETPEYVKLPATQFNIIEERPPQCACESVFCAVSARMNEACLPACCMQILRISIQL
jgi:hypothetical protein